MSTWIDSKRCSKCQRLLPVTYLEGDDERCALCADPDDNTERDARLMDIAERVMELQTLFAHGSLTDKLVLVLELNALKAETIDLLAGPA